MQLQMRLLWIKMTLQFILTKKYSNKEFKNVQSTVNCVKFMDGYVQINYL